MKTKIPDDAIENGSFMMKLFIDPEGTAGMLYDFNSCTRPVLIGYLTVVLDRLRAEERNAWEDED